MNDLERIAQQAKDFFKNAPSGYYDIRLRGEFHFDKGRRVNTPGMILSSAETFRFTGETTDVGVVVVLSDSEEILPYENLVGYDPIDRAVGKTIKLEDEIHL